MISEDLDRQHRRKQRGFERVAPCDGVVAQRERAGIACGPAGSRHVDDGVEVVREEAAGLFEAGRIGVVEDDRVDVEFLGGDLEIVAAGPGDHHRVAPIAEALRDGASEFGVATGEQHVHDHDLLVFGAEPSESCVMLLDSS